MVGGSGDTCEEVGGDTRMVGGVGDTCGGRVGEKDTCNTAHQYFHL